MTGWAKSEVQSAQEIWVQYAVELQNGTASDLAVYAKNVDWFLRQFAKLMVSTHERKKMPSQGGQVGESMLTVIAAALKFYERKRRQLLTSASAASFGRPLVTGALGSQDRHRDSTSRITAAKPVKKGVRFGPALVALSCLGLLLLSAAWRVSS